MHSKGEDMIADWGKDPTVNWKVVADQQVTSLRSALYHGTHDLQVIPKLLRTLLQGDLWKCRYVEQIRQEVEFKSFVEFVGAKAPQGLGTDVQTLKKFCQSAGDMEAVDLIDGAEGSRQGERTDLVSIIHEVSQSTSRPAGTTAARALRALRKKNESLHARVLAGEISPHGAMVEAGLRVKTHTIPHDPVRAAGVIGRHFSRTEVVWLLYQLKHAFEISDEEIEHAAD